MRSLLLRSSLGCLATAFGSSSASRNKFVTQAAAVPHLFYFRKTMHYQTEERGHPHSPDYRIYFNICMYAESVGNGTRFCRLTVHVERRSTLAEMQSQNSSETSEGKYISPFHDISLIAETEQDNDVPAKKPKKNENEVLFNMVVEVPRWSNAKMEIATKEPLNPIKQDVKKGKLRYVANIFPHKGYIWNYGALPQTWEDPNHTDKETKCCGDNDPIDVCEIGTQVCFPGQVIKVKVLGILAMIDEGEMDWKVIAINAEDPDAKHMNNIEDVRKWRPGHLEASVDWFKKYKVPDGKPENQFGFNGQFKDKDFAVEIIKSTHEHWRALVQKQTNSGGIECKNFSCCESPFKCSADEARDVVESAPAFGSAHPVSPEVDKWHFV